MGLVDVRARKFVPVVMERVETGHVGDWVYKGQPDMREISAFALMYSVGAFN